MTIAAAPTTPAKFRDYLDLTKPRLSLLSVLTALVGYLATRPPSNPTKLFFVLLSTSLAAGGVAAQHATGGFRIDDAAHHGAAELNRGAAVHHLADTQGHRASDEEGRIRRLQRDLRGLIALVFHLGLQADRGLLRRHLRRAHKVPPMGDMDRVDRGQPNATINSGIFTINFI